MKCNPAIKSAADRAALRKALGTGLIDTIGTDHAPHLRAEKFTSSCFTAKSGFPGVQHSLDLMAEAVGEGWLSLPQMARLMCHNPATLYRIEGRGFIREGYHADLVIADLSRSRQIQNSEELSKCGWTPYDGRTVHTTVTHTFVNGELVYENGVLHEEVRGKRLKFNR